MMQVTVMCNSVGDQDKEVEAGLFQSQGCFVWARPVLEAMFLEKKGILGRGQGCVNLCTARLFLRAYRAGFLLGRRTEDCIVCVCNLFTWIGSKASKCSSQCGIGTEESMSHWASCLPNNQKSGCVSERLCVDGSVQSVCLFPIRVSLFIS